MLSWILTAMVLSQSAQPSGWVWRIVAQDLKTKEEKVFITSSSSKFTPFSQSCDFKVYDAHPSDAPGMAITQTAMLLCLAPGGTKVSTSATVTEKFVGTANLGLFFEDRGYFYNVNSTARAE